MTNLETYGDLKKAIKIIQLKKGAGKVGGAVANVGIEAAIDAAKTLLPGIGTAKSIFDVLRIFIQAPDTKKTKTWLDKLQVDDETSAIIDDTVENGFIQLMAKSIESESDTKSLEDDFNMNAKLVNYLKNTYKGRTITGIGENKMKTQQLKDIIREELKDIIREELTSSTTVKGDTTTLINNLKKLNIPDFDASKLTTTIALVKQNKTLNIAANKVLADIMTAMIKTNDDALLTKIFSNLKNIEAV